MCKFLSLLVFTSPLKEKYGEIVNCTDYHNSHSETERELQLNVKHDHLWAKVEITPNGYNILDFDNYQFKLDEDRKPDWWNQEIQDRVLDFGKKEIKRRADEPRYPDCRYYEEKLKCRKLTKQELKDNA